VNRRAISAPPAQFTEYLRAHQRFVIASHEKPDGDCICASLALASFLTRQKKEVLLYNPGPFARREIRQYKKSFAPTIPPSWRGGHTALILIDCAMKERARIDEAEWQSEEYAIIDHHPLSAEVRAHSKESIQYICPAAPSTTLLIQSIIEDQDAVSQEESYYILLGFLTDSGFFRHLDAAASDSLEYASRLLRHQHSLRALYKQLYGQTKMQEMRFISEIILHTQSFLQGRLLIATRTKAMSNKYNIQYISGEQVNAQLQMVKGGEVVALITELEDSAYDVSLRASGMVNVAAIAEKFGGGGHVSASGFRWVGTLESIQMQLIQKVGALVG